MSQEQKKKKKKRQINAVEKEQIESPLLPELVEALDEAAKEKKYADIQVCPKCKSPLIKRVDSVGDMWAHIGITPPNFQCRECGWRQKMVLKATNKPTTANEVAVMADAIDAERRRKRWFK
jgi:hypothetical protein